MRTDQDLETDLTLRPAGAADLAEIAELYIATRRDALGAMPAPAQDDESIRAWVAALPQTREVWVAEDAEILGFVVLDEAWLDALYVGPAHQGRGIGSLLLDLVKSLRPGGFALWVFASNAAGRGFYHRHGLIELEHTDGSDNEEHAPDIRMAWPGEHPIEYLRGQIDAVDDELAGLLARRFALTAAVQGYKETPGRRGRDLARERAIAERMARHVPGLGAAAVERIMHVVISESLDAFESGTERNDARER